MNQNSNNKIKKIILLDGNSLMFRAYYATAYSGNLMKTSDNLYTNAVYAFVNMMNKILETPNLTNLFVAFDKGKKTFRHQAYQEYKGGRKPMPEEFAMQIPFIKEYLDILKIKRLETDDYEADDLIGTVANLFKDQFDEIEIITGDHDLLQLVGGNVKVLLTKKGLSDLEEYNENNFQTLMGISPKQLIDYKGLRGDSSDNLPGVSGIGDKTALKLLNEYHDLENIIQNVDQIKGKMGEAIKNNQEMALLCKKLATIETNAVIDIKEEETLIKEPDFKTLRAFFEKLEFKSFLKKLPINKEGTLFDQENNVEVDFDENNFYINDLNVALEILNNEVVTIEVELDNDNYHKANLLALGLYNKKAVYLDKTLLQDENLIKALNTHHIFYTTDAKKTYVSLKYLGIVLDDFGFDVTLASYVVNPSYVSSDIKTIMEHFIPTNLAYMEEIYGKKSLYVNPGEAILSKYLLTKCCLVEKVKDVVDEIFKTNNQYQLYYEIELPLAKVLGEVELNGFKVNENKLQEVGNYFNELMKTKEQEIFSLVGHEFNVASPKQLGIVLFEELQLGFGKNKKNKTGYSTSADILAQLAYMHPVPKLVLEYRKYAKLYSTYVVGLLAEVRPTDHKVHTIFKQALTQTGRLSSTEPNIQNIPVRTDEGRIIRSVFIPSFEDGFLVSADYSQVELRILASVAKCQAMIDTFNNEVDLHANTAAKIYNVPLVEVTKEMRRMAKAVNFGIVYGMSDWGLAEELHISAKEANLFIQKYFEVFPEIKPYLDETVTNAKKDGYTTTIYGRRRYLPDLNSSNKALREFSERASMNAPIQGSAADIMKLAMIKVDEAFKKAQLASKIVAQVHDELIVDVPFNELEKVKEILKTTMENVTKLAVKLEVDVEEGKTWDLK